MTGRRIRITGLIGEVDLDQEDLRCADGSRLDEAAAADIVEEVLAQVEGRP